MQISHPLDYLTIRNLFKNFGRNNGPTKLIIYRLMNDFEERGSVGDRSKRGPQHSCAAIP